MFLYLVVLYLQWVSVFATRFCIWLCYEYLQRVFVFGCIVTREYLQHVYVLGCVVFAVGFCFCDAFLYLVVLRVFAAHVLSN